MRGVGGIHHRVASATATMVGASCAGWQYAGGAQLACCRHPQAVTFASRRGSSHTATMGDAALSPVKEDER
ncbi:MAG TPA: hypothetical protein DHU96_05660 [Actinobacteria bacterium]|nr:hypothetical protein [Actinomycetota bacterium]